jgi:hypothetical protein
MALSKVKHKKQSKRLEARIANYEKQPENKASGHKFTKPGSNKK